MRTAVSLPSIIGAVGFAFHIFGNRDTGEVADRGEDVEQVGEGVAAAVGDAGAAEDQWGLHAVFVEALLAEQAVAADRQAVVGGEDDDRVFKLAAIFKGLDDAADVMVD